MLLESGKTNECELFWIGQNIFKLGKELNFGELILLATIVDSVTRNLLISNYHEVMIGTTDHKVMSLNPKFIDYLNAFFDFLRSQKILHSPSRVELR